MTDEDIRDHSRGSVQPLDEPLYRDGSRGSHDKGCLPVRFDDFETSFLACGVDPRLGVVSLDSSQDLESDPPVVEDDIGLDDSVLCRE